MSVKIEGLPRLRAALLRVTDEGERVVKRGVKRSSVAVEAGAKRRSPVDTGRHRNSITHEIRDGGMTGVIGTNNSYGPHLEFGTRFMRAQPHLFPALEEERPHFHARMRRELGASFVRATD